jgi:sirohydrochlorin ferrochelatase
LLIGHGSTRYPDAAAAMRLHAQTLKMRGWCVEIAMLNGQPTVADALVRLGSASVRAVPFFMEDGYFSKVAIPRAVEAVAPGAVRYAEPVGVHDAMASIMVRQALAGCAALGVAPGSAAVVAIGHGSASSPGRTLALHRHCSRVADTGAFAAVRAACLEEAPFAGGVLAALRPYPVVVTGYFANRASHVLEDVPALLAAERAARGAAGPPVRFQGCVADDPAMADIILEQVAGTLPRAV